MKRQIFMCLLVNIFDIFSTIVDGVETVSVRDVATVRCLCLACVLWTRCATVGTVHNSQWRKQNSLIDNSNYS